ncbi:hypothetical protein C8R45DRAFT_1084041 [Mycena sanguinolenta]|nr:hypothetical protein C8R45DRAFT_1084041 [Mycena sanguinolenta]
MEGGRWIDRSLINAGRRMHGHGFDARSQQQGAWYTHRGSLSSRVAARVHVKAFGGRRRRNRRGKGWKRGREHARKSGEDARQRRWIDGKTGFTFTPARLDALEFEARENGSKGGGIGVGSCWTLLTSQARRRGHGPRVLESGYDVDVAWDATGLMRFREERRLERTRAKVKEERRAGSAIIGVASAAHAGHRREHAVDSRSHSLQHMIYRALSTQNSMFKGPTQLSPHVHSTIFMHDCQIQFHRSKGRERAKEAAESERPGLKRGLESLQLVVDIDRDAYGSGNQAPIQYFQVQRV